MKKILFLYNNYEREHTNIELISQELKKYGNLVKTIGFCDKDVLQKILKINPNIVITFPITTYDQIYMYKLVKKICRCVIVTYTTEGLFDLNNIENIRAYAGYYDYSDKLVDYHMFWGATYAKKLGKELYNQKKLHSAKQIKVFGNPMYEIDKFEEKGTNEVINKIENDPNRKVLILTGFHSSEYTIQNFIDAQDIINTKGKTKEEVLKSKELNKWVDVSKYEKIYCEKYINIVLEAAQKNKDITFYVKLHPCEILARQTDKSRIKYINVLNQVNNIVLINQSIPLGSILKYFTLMVHYGSTVDLEAYLYKVPTLKIEMRDYHNDFLCESIKLTESTYYEDINNSNALDFYIKKIRDKEILFKENKKLENQLYDFMNYKCGQPYEPSKEMARFLNSRLRRNDIKLSIAEWIDLLNWAKKRL